MSNKIRLPKQIQNDPRVKQVFGDSAPVKTEQEREPTARSDYDLSYWEHMLEIWRKRQKPRICANPQCLKEYYPKIPMQRFHSKDCYESFHRNGKPNRDICTCGRHSHYLHDGTCSFCREKELKFFRDVRAQTKNGGKGKYKKHYCVNCGSRVHIKAMYQLQGGLCLECFQKKLKLEEVSKNARL
jgi:hypothetical protein